METEHNGNVTKLDMEICDDNGMKMDRNGVDKCKCDKN